MTAVNSAAPAKHVDSVIVTLHAAWGRCDQKIQDVLAVLLSARPDIVWREPTPTRTRLDGFVGLWIADAHTDVSGLQSKWPNVSLDEARLFWANEESGVPRSVHVVADTGASQVISTPADRADVADPVPLSAAGNRPATRWAVFWEDENPQTGQWIQTNLGAPAGSDVWTCRRSREQVITLRDARRYGLEAHHSVPEPGRKPLTVFQYFRGTELVFWQLQPFAKPSAKRSKT